MLLIPDFSALPLTVTKKYGFTHQLKNEITTLHSDMPSTTTSGRPLSVRLEGAENKAWSGPPSISTFLTNISLLNFDRKPDWPGIERRVLVGKDQKIRVRCVEWVLYQLFSIWDPEETNNVRALPVALEVNC